MPSHSRRFADPTQQFPPSRTRQYVEQKATKRAESAEIEALQTQLEDQERRNLRLSRELMDETALRARAERARDDLAGELYELSTQLTKLEGTAKDEPSGSETSDQERSGHTEASGGIPDDNPETTDVDEPGEDADVESTPNVSKRTSKRTTPSKRPSGSSGSSGSRMRGKVT